jgi:nondiscriminating glutamyl-tRNA synthetase
MASIRQLREDGFLRDGIINHLCHLGWSPGKRLLSIQEAVEEFTLKRLSKSPSIFDIITLKRLNRDYLEQTDTDSLVKMTRPHLRKDVPYDWLKDAIKAVRGDARTIKDIALLLEPFLGKLAYNEDAIKTLEEPYVKMLLKALLEEVEKKEEISIDSYRDIVNNLREITRKDGKQLFMPIRAALTGRLRGIELENVFILLGKGKVIERLKRYAT